MRNIISRALARRAKGDAGFTLIELLVVVLILGVLSGITIVAVSDARANSVVSACNTDKVELIKALDAYKADPANDSYPATLSALVPNFLHQLPNTSATKGEYYFSYSASTTPTVTPHASTGKDIVTSTNCPAI
jgi:prepilin-type N-terminal cleavage/methylation domain-containing protein